MQVSKSLDEKVSSVHVYRCACMLLYPRVNIHRQTGRQMDGYRACKYMSAGIQVYWCEFSCIQACKCAGLQRRPGRQVAALWVK